MRIVYVSEGRTPHDERFLRLFASAGHSLGRVALFASPGQPLPGVADLGPDLAAQPGRAPDLARQVVDFAPDVLVAGPLHTAAFAAAFLHPAPLAAVSWGSDVLLHAERDPSARRAAVLALRRASGILADARAVAGRLADLAGIELSRIDVAPWGVDLERFAAARAARDESRWRLGFADTDLVVFSNRALAPLYRPDVALRGFARAAASRPELFLLLAGDGPLAGELAGLVRELGLGGRVRLCGRLDAAGLDAAYAAADVFLSCAESDGSSVSLLEALASGLPALVTDIPSNREWVSPGDNGFLAPADDVPAVGARLLDLAALTGAQRAALGARARAVAEAGADWRRNSAAILRCVERAAGISGKRRAPR